ncbi:hypothetical protein CMV_014176, partial [Castanea mollissima]
MAASKAKEKSFVPVSDKLSIPENLDCIIDVKLQRPSKTLHFGCRKFEPTSSRASKLAGFQHESKASQALPALPCRRPTFPSFKRIVLNKMSTTPSPIYREFISVEGSDINSRSRSDGIRFRLVSYNILARDYVRSSFPHSPSPCLRWEDRSQAILSVLKNFGADFLCLQEVDEYDSFYKGNMESLGYSSIYVQRNGQKRDGCGIFYKQK